MIFLPPSMARRASMPHLSQGRRKQRGQAMVEYIYVFPILLLLIFGAIQFGFIYQAKSTLNYATFKAAREGALNNGSMDHIIEGLTGGLVPLFAHGSTTATDSSGKMTVLRNAWYAANAQVNNPKIMQIAIVNPTPSALSAFQGDSESGDEIPNDNLMYRDSSKLGAGMNVQDANLLKIRVTYCYKLAVPVLNKLIYYLAVAPTSGNIAPASNSPSDTLAAYGDDKSSNFCTAITAKDAGQGDPDSTGDDADKTEYRIPITSEAIVRMQSPFKDPGMWVGPGSAP